LNGVEIFSRLCRLDYYRAATSYRLIYSPEVALKSRIQKIILTDTD
jgi:hypothetical protein